MRATSGWRTTSFSVKRTIATSSTPRKASSASAGPDRRPRQDDPLDLAGHQQVDRSGDREIGLAGTGRTETEHQFMLSHRLDVAGLARAARRDPALAGAEPGVVAPQAEALVVDLGLG